MRIGDRVGARRDHLVSDRVKASRHTRPAPFFNVLREQEAASHEEELDRLLDKLDEQGRRLVHSRTLVDLHAYKELVRQFLQNTIGEGIALKEKRMTDVRGRSRIYRSVEKVNEQLIQLTEDIVKRESNQLRILEKVGQIKGLLIQLRA